VFFFKWQTPLFVTKCNFSQTPLKDDHRLLHLQVDTSIFSCPSSFVSLNQLVFAFKRFASLYDCGGGSILARFSAAIYGGSSKPLLVFVFAFVEIRCSLAIPA